MRNKTNPAYPQHSINEPSPLIEDNSLENTLNSIGDAVISTDIAGNVTYLNTVAESMTGWSRMEAVGRPLAEVLHIIDGATRELARNPMELAIQQKKTVGLTTNCILIRRDGFESAIEDSASPIRNYEKHVTGAVMVFRDVSAARALSQKMFHLAQHDSLTDLPNRVLLNDRLTQAIALAHRHHTQLAVLYLDIDHFKQINDSLGHAVGDKLLRSVAQRLVACVRSSDTVSRQGGDEFVILFSEIERAQDATLNAEKILAALKGVHYIDQDGAPITISMGISIYPLDGQNAQTLIRNADIAMYHAKKEGRNRYQFFKKSMNVPHPVALRRKIFSKTFKRFSRMLFGDELARSPFNRKPFRT